MKWFSIPFAPPSRSPSPAPAAVDCPFKPEERPAPFTFFAPDVDVLFVPDVEDTEIAVSVEEQAGAVDPLDEVKFCPHQPFVPSNPKRISVQTVFYKPK